MNGSKKSTRSIFLITVLFFSGVIAWIQSWLIVGLFCTTALMLIFICRRKYASVAGLFSIFLVGLAFYEYALSYFKLSGISNTQFVLLHRISLLLILIPFVIFVLITHHRRSLFSIFLRFPNFKEHIMFPRHTLSMRTFLFLGILGSCSVFFPLFFDSPLELTSRLIFFSLFFSLVNATIEELLYRGAMLTFLKDIVSTRYAIVVTSLIFGILHLTLGISLVFTVLFSIGGLYYSWVVIKSNSIYPTICFHFVINVGMVWNGWIL
ncbi:type II CAAX endopeptidase family protein [Exiguobacterium sp. OS-77]|uniref:CPBP family intramembrane glutamic endopeptidase n=1 Tax=unclassified Exiguobacterium TaxID=2644629 RepID=UPI0004127CD9